MLYTRKGDDGTTRFFDSKSKGRVSKGSSRVEVLGSLDELNSFLGLVKVKIKDLEWLVNKKKPEEIIHWVQNSLFTIQAEVAGADKKVGKKDVKELEKIIDTIEKLLPPIKTFFISGGTEVAALFDISRTIARRVERRVVDGIEKNEYKANENTLVFLNRLSSLLYALARISNHYAHVVEDSPWYNKKNNI